MPELAPVTSTAFELLAPGAAGAAPTGTSAVIHNRVRVRFIGILDSPCECQCSREINHLICLHWSMRRNRSRRSALKFHALDDLDGLIVGRKEHLQCELRQSDVAGSPENCQCIQKRNGAQACRDSKWRDQTLRCIESLSALGMGRNRIAHHFRKQGLNTGVSPCVRLVSK